MRSVVTFISKRGFALMLCGFFIAIAGSGAYIFFESRAVLYKNTPLPGIALAAAFFGIAVYFVGRVSVAVLRRNKQRLRAASDGDEDDIAPVEDGGKKE